MDRVPGCDGRLHELGKWHLIYFGSAFAVIPKQDVSQHLLKEKVVLYACGKTKENLHQKLLSRSIAPSSLPPEKFGKAKKVALVACMHKLLIILNAIVKSGIPWHMNVKNA